MRETTCSSACPPASWREPKTKNLHNKKSFLKKCRPLLAIIDRNFALTKRYLGWEIVFLSYNIVNALVIGFIGVKTGQVLYLAVGALLWGFLSVLFHDVSECVAWEKWEGTIEYSFMAPIHKITYLLSNCFYAILYGLARTLILLLCIALFFKLSLKNANLLAAFVVLAVSSLPFIGMGLIGAVFPLISVERGAQATHVFEAVLLLVSGVYYEIDVLPKWIQPVSVISPATYTLKAMRAAILEGAGLRELYPILFLLLALSVILIPLGFWIFTLGERHARKVGKLKRSG